MRPIAALAAVVVAATTFGLVACGNSSTGAAQLTSTGRACQQWTGSYAPSDGNVPTRAWCTAMTAWMGQQLHSGHVTGPMMWSDANTMRSTCRQWMSTGAAASSGVSPQACDDMAAWMADHEGNWDNWMMTGRVMGQGS